MRPVRPAPLLLALLLPAVTGCAEAASVPFLQMASAEPAVPPVPAELLAETNGKADPPLQVRMVLALAEQTREARANAVVTARAAEAPSSKPMALAVAAPLAQTRPVPAVAARDRGAGAHADSARVETGRRAAAQGSARPRRVILARRRTAPSGPPHVAGAPVVLAAMSLHQDGVRATAVSKRPTAVARRLLVSEMVSPLRRMTETVTTWFARTFT